MIVAILIALGGIVFIVSVPVFINFAYHNQTLLLGSVIATTVFLPSWWGVTLGEQVIPLSLISVALAIVVCARNITKLIFNRYDLMICALCISILGASAISGEPAMFAFQTIATWFLPYIFGRLLSPRLRMQDVTKMVIFFATILAVWALAEFVFNFHVFAAESNSMWASIQYRAGLPRSEGAMGTSIVLGNALAMCVPFILLAPVRKSLKVVVFVVVLSGILVTFSRNALLALVLAAIVTFMVGNFGALELNMRVLGFLAVVGGLIAVMVPFLSELDSSAGQELANSSDYRLGYMTLLDDVQLLGPAVGRVSLPNGSWGYPSDEYVGGMVLSIDNTPLHLALNFGWISFGILVALLIGLMIIGLRRGETNVALIAVVCMMPTVMTLAMITQFPTLFWLLVGAGVSIWAMKREQHLTGEGVVNRILNGGIGNRMSQSAKRPEQSQVSQGSANRLRTERSVSA